MASHIKISSTESSQEHCVKLNWKMAEVASLGTSGILPSTFLKSILSNWFWSVIWLSDFKLDLNSGILFPSCPKYPPRSWWFILLAISVVSVSWHATCMGSCVITPSWLQSTSFYLIYPASIKWVPLSVLSTTLENRLDYLFPHSSNGDIIATGGQLALVYLFLHYLWPREDMAWDSQQKGLVQQTPRCHLEDPADLCAAVLSPSVPSTCGFPDWEEQQDRALKEAAERLILAGREAFARTAVSSSSWIQIHWGWARTWVFSTLDRNHPALGSALTLRLGFHDSRTSKHIQNRETSKILLFSNPSPPLQVKKPQES